MYKNVMQKGKIGTLELKNRVVMAPMDTLLTGERMIGYYEERAKGGVGLIIVEHCYINEQNGKAGPVQLGVSSPESILENDILAEHIHRHGAKVFFQLNHSGRNGIPAYQLSGETVAPSAVPSAYGFMPRAMTTEEVKEIVQDYVNGAVMAKKAGIDGVEIHCAHGYLISNFISRHSNLREDEYGGSLENRTRIVKEIVAGIKAACGKNYPVTARISALDSNKEGNDIETQLEVAKLIESYGVDAIHMTQGNTDGMEAVSCEPTSYPEGCRTDNISRFREAVSVPLIAVNHLKSLQKAEELIEDGVMDFAAFGRALIADAHLVNKTVNGQEDEVIKCVSCLHCLEVAGGGKNLSCALNPVSCREVDYPELKIDGTGRKVVVVGAGPAGMEAAVTLKKRGFEPVVYEKSDKVGGAFRLGSLPPHKEKLGEYCDRQEALMKKEDIELHLNTAVSKEIIQDENPYAVIYAAGGCELVPTFIKGYEYGVSVKDVLEQKVDVSGKKVVVVGSGMTGIETAEFLGKDNEVTVIEMASEIAPGAFLLNKFDVMMRLMQMGVSLKPNTVLEEITADHIVVKDLENDKAETIPCDLVVLSIGVRSNRKALEEIEEACDNVVMVGDANSVGRVGNAVKTGFDAAMFLQ